MFDNGSKLKKMFLEGEGVGGIGGRGGARVNEFLLLRIHI